MRSYTARNFHKLVEWSKISQLFKMLKSEGILDSIVTDHKLPNIPKQAYDECIDYIINSEVGN